MTIREAAERATPMTAWERRKAEILAPVIADRDRLQRERDELAELARAVCAFDWSDNDADAVSTIDAMRTFMDGATLTRNARSFEATDHSSGENPDAVHRDLAVALSRQILRQADRADRAEDERVAALALVTKLREAVDNLVATYDAYRRRGVSPAPQEYVDVVAAIENVRACLAAEEPKPPYPEFCMTPAKCAGLGCCPRDPNCCE